MNLRTSGAVSIAVLCVLAGCKNQSHQTASSSTPSVVQAAASTPAPATTVPSTVVPHEPTPEEVWSQATPAIRRSILATQIRSTWKNVRVQTSGAVMTITHPGMDEKSARQIIDDIGKLATAAGLRRINFVSAGGTCQYEQRQPHCEITSGIDSYGRPYGGCSNGQGYTYITQTYLAPCPPHTWVYNIPAS